MQTQLDFIRGDTRRCLLSMALPLLAAMCLNMAYNLVDSLWIGNLLGETAYAALTGATPLLLLLNAVAMGAANGVSILLSRAVGAGDGAGVRRMTAASLALAGALSLVMTAGLEAGLGPLLALLHTPAETFEMARSYLAVYLLGYPAVFLYCYFTAVLRSFGNTSFQVLAMLVSTVLNGLLDPLFIHWAGLRGAAAATLLSQTVCLVFMLAYLGRRRLLGLSRFSLRDWGPFLAAGLPAALQQSIPAVSAGFLTALVGGFGITALAAYGIAGKLETLLFYPAMVLNMALTAIVGQCAGGGRRDRGADYLRTALGLGCGALAALSLLVVCFAESLAGLFVDSPGAAAMAAGYFRVVAAGYVLNTATNCFLGGLNGLGRPGRSLLCMALYYLVVRMPLAALLARFGLNGIWAAVLVSHAVAALTALLLFRAALRRPGAGA